MKVKYFFIILPFLVWLTSCSNDLDSGREYPILEMGNSTITYKIDKVLQNDIDVKPYFNFFDQVELKLGYKDNAPATLIFSEVGAPFRVTSVNYTDKIEFDWEINTSKYPYEIRNKATGEVFCHLTKDQRITFSFKLGCPSNKYEYQLAPISESN